MIVKVFLMSVTTGNSLVTNKQPELAVIVCVHNAPDYTRACLESVLRHTEQPYELIIVNDGSKAETTKLVEKYAKEFDHITLLTNLEAQGYTRAANRGLRASKTTYSILLNSDTVASPNWAERMIACAKSDPKIGIVGALSNAATYQSVPFVFDDTGFWKQNELPKDVTVAGYARMVAKVSWQVYPRVPVANGFCFMVCRPLIESIGYLDEVTFPRGYGEENDYCLRAADAGFEIAIADDTYVYHATSKSFGVKQREQLTGNAHQAIRGKHGDARLAQVDHGLRNHPVMDEVRARVRAGEADGSYFGRKGARVVIKDFAPSNDALSMVFLTEKCEAKAGGTQMVVELAHGLKQIGVRVCVVAHRAVKDEYLRFFADKGNLFAFYDEDAQLTALCKDYRFVTATMWSTVEKVKSIIAQHDGQKAAYFVQDYEPYFYDTATHPQEHQGALASYELIQDNMLFAISPWVCEIVKEKHGLQVHKIPGCLETQLFYPDVTRDTSLGVLNVVAMVRVHTPWRGTAITMRVLKRLKDAYGDAINVCIFGSRDESIAASDVVQNFKYANYGVLSRTEVALLMRNADMFLDYSDFQAFGRPALEAMACGAAVVAPLAGGVKDFGRDGVNILQIDTKDEEACFGAAKRLIDDAALREKLGTQACADAQNMTIRHAALAFARLCVQQ